MADDPTISLADLLIVIQKARQFLSEPFVGALFLMALLQLVGFKGRAGERGASLAGRVRGSVECFRVRTRPVELWSELAKAVDRIGSCRAEALKARPYTEEWLRRQRKYMGAEWPGLLVYDHSLSKQAPAVAPEDKARCPGIGDSALVFELGCLLFRLLTNTNQTVSLDPATGELPCPAKPIPPFEGSTRDIPDLVESRPRSHGVEDLLQRMLCQDAIRRGAFGLVNVVRHPWVSRRARFAGFSNGREMAQAVALRLAMRSGDDWCPYEVAWRSPRQDAIPAWVSLAVERQTADSPASADPAAEAAAADEAADDEAAVFARAVAAVDASAEAAAAAHEAALAAADPAATGAAEATAAEAAERVVRAAEEEFAAAAASALAAAASSGAAASPSVSSGNAALCPSPSWDSLSAAGLEAAATGDVDLATAAAAAGLAAARSTSISPAGPASPAACEQPTACVQPHSIPTHNLAEEAARAVAEFLAGTGQGRGLPRVSPAAGPQAGTACAAAASSRNPALGAALQEALHALAGRVPNARFEGARSVTLSPAPADGANSDDWDDDSSAAEEDGDGDCDSVDSSNVGDLQEERVRAEADELADTIALPRQSRNAAKWHFRDHTGSLLPRFGIENQGPRDQDSMSSRASSAASPASTRAQKRRRDDDADSDDSDDDADCGDGSDSDGNSSEQSAGSKVMRMDDFA